MNHDDDESTQSGNMDQCHRCQAPLAEQAQFCHVCGGAVAASSSSGDIEALVSIIVERLRSAGITGTEAILFHPRLDLVKTWCEKRDFREALAEAHQLNEEVHFEWVKYDVNDVSGYVALELVKLAALAAGDFSKADDAALEASSAWQQVRQEGAAGSAPAGDAAND